MPVVMYDFFILLFIGTVLLLMKCRDVVFKKREEKRKRENKESEDSFFGKYELSAGETEYLKNLVRNKDNEVMSLRDELKSVIGGNLEPTKAMYFWGYLAKQGSVPDRLSIEFNNDFNILYNEHDIYWRDRLGFAPGKIDEVREARLKFLKWMDNEMYKNGMESRLLYVRKDPDDNSFDIYTGAVSIQYCRSIYPTLVFWKEIAHIINRGSVTPYTLDKKDRW